MNFQDLKKVETADWYIDLAFSSATKAAEDIRGTLKGTPLSKSRSVELAKLAKIRSVLVKHLNNILEGFPSIDQLPVFYNELVRCSLDYSHLKKSLGGLNWAIERIESFYKKYSGRIKASRENSTINSHRREFYGRISSVMKQISGFLKFIEQSRVIMKSFPAIKTSIPTVAIFGFPNVGKSTLLSKLTGSKPDIQPYAFTTKGLNIGYIKKGYDRFQFIDTPGSLDRFEKMNSIEKQAYLAVKHCANKIIYVFDLTEPYPLSDQLKLYKRIKKEVETAEKEILVYFSKSDVLGEKPISEFIRSNSIKHAYFEVSAIFKHLKI